MFPGSRQNCASRWRSRQAGVGVGLSGDLRHRRDTIADLEAAATQGGSSCEGFSPLSPSLPCSVPLVVPSTSQPRLLWLAKAVADRRASYHAQASRRSHRACFTRCRWWCRLRRDRAGRGLHSLLTGGSPHAQALLHAIDPRDCCGGSRRLCGPSLGLPQMLTRLPLINGRPGRHRPGRDALRKPLIHHASLPRYAPIAGTSVRHSGYHAGR
jgi:hypothetical protein